MSRTNNKTPVPLRDREFAPMAPEAFRRALTPRALALYLEVQSRPPGWTFADRETEARRMGWTVYAYRKAITELRALGLFVVDKVRDAAGRWHTRSWFNSTSPQVTPEAGSQPKPRAGNVPSFLVSKEKRERGPRVPHTPETCRREADNLPCSHCGKIRQARAKAAAPRLSPFLEARFAEMGRMRGITAAQAEAEARAQGWMTTAEREALDA